MNWLDLGVIGIIVLSAVFAFARGFVREALSIVACCALMGLLLLVRWPTHAQSVTFAMTASGFIAV